MLITEKKRIRGSLYRLTLEAEEPLTIDIDAATMDESGYGVHSDITPVALENLMALSRRNRARSRALYYLSGRDYAAKELERKLYRTAEKETAAAVVERLCEVGLVNDAAYAMRLARSLSETRLYPRRRVLQTLREKGIGREDAQTAVDALETDDAELALALIRKKYYNKMYDAESREKVAAALVRYGFGYDAVRRAMQQMCDDEI